MVAFEREQAFFAVRLLFSAGGSVQLLQWLRVGWREWMPFVCVAEIIGIE